MRLKNSNEIQANLDKRVKELTDIIRSRGTN